MKSYVFNIHVRVMLTNMGMFLEIRPEGTAPPDKKSLHRYKLFETFFPCLSLQIFSAGCTLNSFSFSFNLIYFIRLCYLSFFFQF